MANWLRCAVNLALPATLAACLGVQPGEIAWPGSRIWESAPAEASLADARSPTDLPGADLAREIELAQGRATLPERPVLAEAQPDPQATGSAVDDPLAPGSPELGPDSSLARDDSSRTAPGASPAAGPVVLRVVAGTDLVPPGTVPAIQAEHEYQLYFELGSSDLDGPSRRVLHKLIGNALLIRPSRILVVGHTDRSGATDLNKELSMRRAQTVAARLQEAGVPLEKIELRALGESGLAEPTGDGAPNPGNRRVAVRLL
jgi:outer membrane protein OmpA-like peptidoglycan-associated protein